MPDAELVISARRALRAAWDRPVELGEPEPLWRRDHVLRLPVLDPVDTASSVIVKAARSADDVAQASFAAELAALQAIGTTEDPVSARFLAASTDPPFVVMEDVHHGPSLADLLLGGDRDTTTSALVTYAEGLGDLHVATIAAVDVFDERVRALGHDPARSSFGSFPQRRARWEEDLTGLGIDGNVARDDLDAIARSLADPGEFRGIVHGDPCPDNVRFVDGRLRVFDFEWASTGHVLLDDVYLSVPFPTCWCVGSLPPALVAAAEVAYRTRLGVDEARWERERRLVWAAWLVATTANLLRRVDEGDNNLWGTTNYKTRITGRLGHFAHTAGAADPVPALTDVVATLYETLVARWPEEDTTLPAYPVFAAPGERTAQVPEWWFEGA